MDKQSSNYKKAWSRLDALYNSLTGWGSRADPLMQTTFMPGTLFNREELENFYRYDWLIRRVMEVIPGDAVRQGINMKAEDEEIITTIDDKLNELDTWEKLKEGMQWARLYGGSVVIVGAMDGQEVHEELNEDAIKGVEFLNVMDRWQLTVKDRYVNPLSPKYGKPETYTLQPIIHGSTGVMGKVKEMFQHGTVIHETRLLRFDGAKLPDLVRQRNQGWSDSLMVGINETFKQYGTTVKAGSILMIDFITKVLKIPNLAELIMNNEWSTIQTRIQYAMAGMSNMGLTLIGNEETFEKVQNRVTGVVDMVDKYIEIMSAATDIPKSRLFGQQLGKLAGATETTRAYYDIVQDYQKDNLKKPVNRLLNLLLKDPTINPSKKTPDGWGWEFNSLWQIDPKTQAETRKSQAEADQIYVQNQVVTPEEVANSRFGGDGWSGETTLDMETRNAMKGTPDLEEPEPGTED